MTSVELGAAAAGPEAGALPLRPRAPSVLSRHELSAILQASTGEPRGNLVLFLAFTGVRLSEALNLRWSEVDLDARTATIRRPVRLRRKDLPTVRLAFRTIDLAAPVVAELARRRGRSRAADLVFERERGGGSVDPRELRHALRRIAEHAGLTAVEPRVLRHTWARLMLDAGAAIGYVSRSLGHGSTAYTAAAYAAARPTLPATSTAARSPRRAMMAAPRP